MDHQNEDESELDKSKTQVFRKRNLLNKLTNKFKRTHDKKLKRRNSHDLSCSKQTLTDDDNFQLFSDKKKNRK